MALFAVFIFSLFILHHRVTSDPPAEEREALISFISQVTHHASDNWNMSEPTCSWKGVFCDPTNTTIIQLSLPGASLTGEIPGGTIGQLSNLLVLCLSNNKFTGRIPFDFSFLALMELYLDNNSFSGYLPYINTDDLEILNVSNNAFNCSIPRWFSKFPESSFSHNKNLCGHPLPSCSSSEIVCEIPRDWQPYYVIRVKQPIAIVIYAGLGLLLLIIICCLRKKLHKRSKQPPKPSLEAPAEGERNKLVLFEDGINNFDCDELLQASAEILGKGSVGTSYKRVLEEKQMTVVLKRLKDAVTDTEFESHMEVLGDMKNEHLVPLRGYCYSKYDNWLVYDYMPAGSLCARLHGLSETRLNWEQRKKIALCAARGVAYLHARNVVHGNIKSSNILLRPETNKYAVVSDYSLYTLFDKPSTPNQLMGYWAPEVFRTQVFSLQSDVYSFGVLLLELLTGQNPNQALGGWNDFRMWVQLVVCDKPKVEIFDLELQDQNINELFQMLRIAKDCVSIVPDQRPTMHNVVSMMNDANRVELISGSEITVS